MLRSCFALFCGAILFLPLAPIQAAEPRKVAVEQIDKVHIAGLHRSALGVTRQGTEIACFISDDDLDYNTSKIRILLVGGLDGSPSSVRVTLDVLKEFYNKQATSEQRKRFALSAAPCINPDGIAAGKGTANLSGGNPALGYPPKGAAYHSATDPEAAYLWRWIGMHAPDLVVEVRTGKALAWHVPTSSDSHLKPLAAQLTSLLPAPDQDSLVSQLVKAAPSEIGTIPAIQVTCSGQGAEAMLSSLLAALSRAKFENPSPARLELQKRLDRTPLEVATQLSKHYGHNLGSVAYIPALALMSRIRLGELTDNAEHLGDVEKIAAPYFTGKKSSTPKSGSGISGHLVFTELARVTKGERRDRYLKLAQDVADLAFDEQGKPQPSMPYHVEMSDSVFMGGPILARVGELTGETKYFDACARHIAFMRKLCARKDGLYRNSPLAEAAWGRGNGFPALGLSMSLSAFPKDHPDRETLVAVFREHMVALSKHQDPNGCWHQVIDRPGSYRELTCTAMISFAMVRGMRLGLLEEETYRPIVERAWYALRTRIAPNGRLVDVCTGTGKQKNLRGYYDRTAILGPDARGGAMALLISTELARWEKERGGSR